MGTRPTASPEYGDRTSIQSPVSTHSPPIRSFRSVAVAATWKSTPVDVPDVSYARSGNTAIAYQAVGDGPSDLVLLPFLSNLYTLWQGPRFERSCAAWQPDDA